MAQTQSSFAKGTLNRWRSQAAEASAASVRAGLLRRVREQGVEGLDEGQLIVAWKAAIEDDDPVITSLLAREMDRLDVKPEWRERGAIPLTEYLRRHGYVRQPKDRK